MNKGVLIVLAYNEESNIELTILKYKNLFKHVLVVNDASSDSTKKILEELSLKIDNLLIINNKKNLGAGYSFQKSLDYIKQNLKDIEFIVKIDGDDQFDEHDIIQIKRLLEKNEFDYVKSNRFWENGIEGKIPLIRYVGNSLASLLIKFITGQFKLTDPLNGLYGFKIEVVNLIKVPKIFKRYGYPFYLNTMMVQNKIKTAEILNKVKYNIGENSQLSAVPLLFRLIRYSVKYFLSNINFKLKDSELQISAILDFLFIFLQFFSIFPIYKIFSIRYFESLGIQTNWLIVFIFIQIFSIFVVYKSKTTESKSRSSYFFIIKQ